MTDPSRSRLCAQEAVDDALRSLDVLPVIVSAAQVDKLAGLDMPGLYSWWVDAEGASALAVVLGAELGPGRIYAGQTGATKWPSGKQGAMTLRQRLRGNHLRGSVYGSTFRRTLASCLREPLALTVEAPRRLARSSEHALSGWMDRHLSLAAFGFADRDTLGDLETRVLRFLDPPLNLGGVPSTPLRARLAQLRADLATAEGEDLSADGSQESLVKRSSVVAPRSSRGVTLHDEILQIVEARGQMTTREIAAAVNERGNYIKRDGSLITDFQVHGRTKNYPHLFARDGQLVIPRAR
jgi:hypothetical protein